LRDPTLRRPSSEGHRLPYSIGRIAPNNYPRHPQPAAFPRLGRPYLALPAIFTVDPRSGVPIYIQLSDQVKRAIALGALSPGEQLPTVKALALELTINPNTVARVYRELERDGVIETSPGRGSFVSADNGAAAPRQAIGDLARQELDEVVRDLKSLGFGRTELRTLFEDTLKRWFSAKEHENTP
jgi:GntR family transcriptional regulator